MAKVEYGSITVNSTGNKIPILSDTTLVVERVVLFIASSSSETSAGYYDTSATFTGGSAYGDENDTKTITHYRNVGGVKTKVFEGIVTNLDTGEFTVNVSTLTQSTSLKFVVFGS
jgi:hypothetical protein